MIKTAVVLAAGRGTRLRPLTDSVPKVLIPVKGTPILDRIVNEVQECGVQRIVFVVGHLGEKVQAHYTGWPNSSGFTFANQQRLDGTAGAIRRCADRIVGDFIVVFGDSLFAKGSIRSVIESHQQNAIAVTAVKDPRRYGVVEVDENDQLIDLVEKPAEPKSNLAIAGMYKMNNSCISYFQDLPLSSRGEYEMPDAVKIMIADGVVFGVVRVPKMIDVGTHEELSKVQEFFDS